MDESARDWAKTVRLGQPVRWGDVEAEILARDASPSEHQWLVRFLGTFGWLWVLVLSSITIGAPTIGFTLVWIARASDDGDHAKNLLLVAAFAFSAAAITQISLLARLIKRRERNLIDVPTAALATVSCAATWVVGQGLPTGTAPGWLTVLLLVTSVAAVLAFVLSLISKPEGRAKSRKPPRRGPRRAGMNADYMSTRREVLSILIDRRQVELDEADRVRMSEMPLGYWTELDDVDETERKRILELRLVGWRDFDTSDRRPWPPPR